MNLLVYDQGLPQVFVGVVLLLFLWLMITDHYFDHYFILLFKYVSAVAEGVCSGYGYGVFLLYAVEFFDIFSNHNPDSVLYKCSGFWFLSRHTRQ